MLEERLTHATCPPRSLPNVVVRVSQVYAGSGAHQAAPHTALRPCVSKCLQGNHTRMQKNISPKDIEIVTDLSPRLASEKDKEMVQK